LTTLLHDRHGDTYAVVGEREVYAIRSRVFRLWLSAKYYAEHRKSPSGSALTQAIQTLEGIALHDSPLESVHLRVAEHDGAIYYDLADRDRRIVRVTVSGWQVIDATSAPVRFVRPATMMPLPVPERCGSIDALRSCVSLRSDDDFVLLLAWLVSVPPGPRSPEPPPTASR